MDKVCFDACKMQNMYSGLGQFCLNLATAIQQINRGYAFEALLPKKLANHQQYPFSTASVSWHHRYISPIKAEVLHCTHQESYLKPSAGCKMVLTIHDLNFLHRPMPQWKRKMRLSSIQRKIDVAHALVFISEYVKKECEAYLSIKDKPKQVIYNGVPSLGSTMQKPEGIPELPFIFSIGALLPRKNFKVLIKMLPHLPGLNLIIAGQHNKSSYPDLLDCAKSHGVAQRVFFPGAVSNAERHWLYAHCEAFVFPSLAEGFGLPVVEAFSLGKPAVLSKDTSLPEIGGENAVYFTDFEPSSMAATVLQTIENNTPESSEMRRNYAGRFSWNRAAEEYHQLYLSLLNQ